MGKAYKPKHIPIPRPQPQGAAHFGVSVRLNMDDLTRMEPEQIKAVMDGMAAVLAVDAASVRGEGG